MGQEISCKMRDRKGLSQVKAQLESVSATSNACVKLLASKINLPRLKTLLMTASPIVFTARSTFKFWALFCKAMLLPGGKNRCSKPYSTRILLGSFGDDHGILAIVPCNSTSPLESFGRSGEQFVEVQVVSLASHYSPIERDCRRGASALASSSSESAPSSSFIQTCDSQTFSGALPMGNAVAIVVC